MFVVVVILIVFLIFGQIQLYFGHVQKLTFVVVKFWSSSNVKVCRQFFLSNSNCFLVILIWSSEIASLEGFSPPTCFGMSPNV